MLVAVATVVTLSLSPISGASPLVPVYDGPVLAARQSDSAGSFAHPAINVTGEGGWGWAVKKARQAVSTLNLAEKSISLVELAP